MTTQHGIRLRRLCLVTSGALIAITATAGSALAMTSTDHTSPPPPGCREHSLAQVVVTADALKVHTRDDVSSPATGLKHKGDRVCMIGGNAVDHPDQYWIRFDGGWIAQYITRNGHREYYVQSV